MYRTTPQLGASIDNLQNLPSSRSFKTVVPWLPLMWVETPPVTVTADASSAPDFSTWLEQHKTAVIVAAAVLGGLALIKTLKG